MSTATNFSISPSGLISVFKFPPFPQELDFKPVREQQVRNGIRDT